MARPSNRFLALLICLGLVVVTWLVFGPTRNYPFVNYDDPGYVAENPDISRDFDAHLLPWAFSYVHGGNWHPLTTLSHWADVKAFGAQKAGRFHLVNVILHTIAVLLLFVVLLRMTGSPSSPRDESVSPQRPDRTGGPSGTGNIWPSAFVAALFAIHPLRVESVAWISERKDVLSAVFFMVTLAAYVSYMRRPSLGRYLLVLLVFALGLLSKSMLLTTPFVMLLLDYWPLGRLQTSRLRSATAWQADVGRQMSDRRSLTTLVLEKIPLFVLSAGAAIATFIAQKQAQAVESVATLPITWRIGNAFVSCVVYVWQFVWPRDLAVIYPHLENQLPLWQPIAAALFILGISYLAIRGRRRFPYVLVGWLWYLIMLVPVLGIVQVGLQSHADRFTYLPGIGLAMIAAWGIADLSVRWPARRIILAGVGAAIVLALAWLAKIQVAYWKDGEILWQHTLAVTKNNDIAHTNYSELLLRRRQFPEAIAQAEAAEKIRPDSAQAYTNLGYAYMRTGKAELARSYLERSLKLRPEGINASMSLALILATCPDESIRDGDRAIQLAESAIEKRQPSNAFDLHILAAAFAEAHRYPEAVAAAEEALRKAKADRNSSLMEELELNLQNYRANLPLRDYSLIGQPPPSPTESR
jgi:tetratricopeptide (TPR) repeat protein